MNIEKLMGVMCYDLRFGKKQNVKDGRARYDTCIWVGIILRL
jgi:hypothetical protein